MRDQFTVYFDTSFYIQLSRAEECIAVHILKELNALGIQHVISNVILRELLTCADKSESDAILVNRLSWFTIPPLCLSRELKWEALLLSGRQRSDLAELLKGIHDQIADAKSHALMARKDLDAEKAELLKESAKPLLKEYGFPADFEGDPDQSVSAARALIENLGVDGINWPDSITPETLMELSEELFAKIPPILRTQIEEEHRLEDSVTESEDRPYLVATRLASKKVKKRLVNTFVDTEHMAMFLKHRNDIDALQVDRAQLKLIQRPKPKHHIQDVGVANRCFSAGSLELVVNELRKLIVRQ